MNVKKIMGWTAAAFGVWFVITEPGGAAGVLQSMGGLMADAADGMSTFVTSMF